MKRFDYVVIGSGFFGAVFSYLATAKGKSCLVIDKRNHIGGNCYTERIEGINVHKYGPHIFHTSNKSVWNFINQFAEFNRFTNMPVAKYNGKIYNLPFNMNTFSQMFNIATPVEAKIRINEEREKYYVKHPKNLEEQAINLVGKTIYDRLIKGYTEKQWGRKASELPAFIIKRLPLRFTYDNNYYNDLYQGIPIGGYTQIFEKLLEKSEVKLEYDFFEHKDEIEKLADKIVFTGQIDAYFNYCYGKLEYRTVEFETKVLDMENCQGSAIVNYPNFNVPYTRVIEHKHFEFGNQPKTVISKEYSKSWTGNNEPYYPVNNEMNNSIFKKYKLLANEKKNVIFGGRLGTYRYLDMHQVIAEAIELAKTEFTL